MLEPNCLWWRWAPETLEALRHNNINNHRLSELYVPITNIITERKKLPNITSPLQNLFVSNKHRAKFYENATMIPQNCNMEISDQYELVVTSKGHELIRKVDSNKNRIMLREFLDHNAWYFNTINTQGLICDLLSGLAFLHDKNYFHADVRIENICFDESSKKFKLLLSEQSFQLQSSQLGIRNIQLGEVFEPRYVTLEKLGVILVVFEVTGIVTFESFKPDSLTQYLSDLERKFPFTVALQGILEEKEREEIPKLYANLSLYKKFERLSAKIYEMTVSASKEDFKKLMKEIGKLQEELADFPQIEGNPIVPSLVEIMNLNRENKKIPIQIVQKYRESLLEAFSLTESSYKRTRCPESEKWDSYYVSGCVLNYHLHCVNKINSAEDLIMTIEEGRNLVCRYGSKLEYHPQYKLSRLLATNKALEEDKKIRKELKSQNHPRCFIIDLLTQLTKDLGIQTLLNKEETLKEFDCLHLLATGSLCDKFVRITMNGYDQKCFKEMANSRDYADKIYTEARIRLGDSNKVLCERLSETTIVAFEYDSALTAVIRVPNFPIEAQIIGENIRVSPIMSYLNLNMNQFDPLGNIEWGKNFKHNCEERGGLKYNLPIGWKGYGLKVADKYGDNNNWLLNHDLVFEENGLLDQSKSGWAVGFHGITRQPKEKIPKIINENVRPGERQSYKRHRNVNPLTKEKYPDVGEGIYFANKIELYENEFAKEVKLEGKCYKVLLQCRLDPSQIRIPEGVHDYYIVPDGSFARPYRFLVKERNSNKSIFGSISSIFLSGS